LQSRLFAIFVKVAAIWVGFDARHPVVSMVGTRPSRDDAKQRLAKIAIRRDGGDRMVMQTLQTDRMGAPSDRPYGAR